ncbi:MAG: hypothetical protein ABI794_13970 [Betaproteobacteria bacterium]
MLAITWALWAPGSVARAEGDAEALARLRSEIAAAVGEPVCGNVSACRLIPMGSDECGNPTLWVPYNNAPDLKITLETKAAEYTFIQEDHQRGKPKRADCVPAVPPRFACVNHRCVLGDASY